ncbi:ATP-grasp domain-containing protein [Mesorhizobium sp. M1027]|uniref:D-alanine--D-alanine ligase family protein n=1 Tax=Mesorhizobium sp. M1027 TaxID=2957050 RepID=UPI003339C1AC
MRVAVVWNNDYTGVINQFGQPRPRVDDRETVEMVMAALQEGGHETLLCEGDKELLATLERFMPADRQARPSGIVFNRTYGIQGECPCSHIPAMLEMAGVPYTGSSPLGHGLATDKVITKILIRNGGVPTPNFRVMRSGTESTGDLRFPLVVKPRYGSTSRGLQFVDEPAQLRQTVEGIVTHYAQDALVEEYIDGREIHVQLLGNAEFEALPLVEYDFGDRENRLLTWEVKCTAAAAVPSVCPAQIGSNLARELQDISVATFRACHCRDYARVDLRIDRSGRPFVLEINSMPGLGKTSSSLVNRILDVAHTRYFGTGITKSFLAH